MKVILETPRLILREMDDSDVEGFFEMDSDPMVARYVGTPPVQSREQCLEIIQFIQKQYIAYGIGRWSVILKSTGEFIGWCGLKRMAGLSVNGHTDFVDICYRFLQRHWGMGYATESAQATLEYGFSVLGLDEICAFADLRNEASQRILSKIGLERGNEFEWEGNTHVWFRKSMT
jgi:ribosomal-protein-alanine N-acetyltransferase